MKINLIKDIKIRKRWVINPRVRVKKSAKIYSRKKAKPQVQKIIKEL